MAQHGVHRVPCLRPFKEPKCGSGDVNHVNRCIRDQHFVNRFVYDWILIGWTAWEELFVRLSRMLRAIPCPGPFCLESWSVSLIFNCGCLLTKRSTCLLMLPHRRPCLRLVQCWRVPKMNSTSRMPASYYLPGVMIKLFIHPLLLCSYWNACVFLGLSIDTFILTTIVLLGACLVPAMCHYWLRGFKADSSGIAQIILLTTTATFFTFSVAVAIMT